MARAPAGVGDPVSGEQEQEEEQRPGLGPRPRPRVGSAQVPMSTSYIPTEEERRVFRECNQESFYYRYGHKRPMALFEEEQGSSTGVLANIYPSTNITKTDYLVMPFVGPFCANWLPHFPTLQQCNSGYNSLGCKALWDMLNLSKALHKSLPFSGMSMLVTQVLISRGILSTSTRFGSIPKVAFAGVCGYLVGKFSYMKTCQEKFMKLENSPLGEALRQGRRTFPHQHSYQKSEFADSTVQHQALPSSSNFQPEAYSPSSYSDDYSQSDRSMSNYDSVPFSSTLSESAPTGFVDTPGAPGPEIEESKPQRKPMSYEELRNKNRELYEVTVTQKAESLHKPTPERFPDKEAKTNKYGDSWEE
ncbi:OCIA domain-containing protein 1 isoform X1 [Heptranchias perlo]|uniref:OCIA domain-containing protein 1 isoform X1 n=1 Tax=Heptranchias perlo TaxID=212740 RepID=UPI00355A1406